MEFRLLGPLEARVAGEAVTLGGAKQRGVLAVLLLRADEVVPVERLIDEIWGDSPPPSAAHSLEAYVSRLRQLFNGHGPSLVRRGAGYSLELGDAQLDVRDFMELLDGVSHALEASDDARVSRLAADALALWRGPALADVALASAGRVEAERLEELRLRTLEQRFDARLALGRDEKLVGELQVLVGQNPYRERFVAQLMLALYRSGRHADALDAYEKTRTALDDDLGLQPSAELQQLSGQIVRQEPALQSSTVYVRQARRGAIERNARRVSGLVLAGAVTVAAMALTANGSTPNEERASPTTKRVAIVLPGSDSEELSHAARSVSVGVRRAQVLNDLETETLLVNEHAGDSTEIERLARRIDLGGFGIVIVLGDGKAARALSRHVRKLPEVRFVFIDASLRDLSLENASNAIAVRFADEDSTYLAGYLTGLAEPMDGSSDSVERVSVVAGLPTSHTKRAVAEFTRGLRNSIRGVDVRVDYSRELVEPTRCEQLANRQIDSGSDVVFVVAGQCGLGALAVARLRGVWGIGADDDGVGYAPHVLAFTYKEWERAAERGVEGALNRTLLMGKDLVLGLEDDYAVGLQMSYQVPEHIQSLVVSRCSEIRASRHPTVEH